MRGNSKFWDVFQIAFGQRVLTHFAGKYSGILTEDGGGQQRRQSCSWWPYHAHVPRQHRCEFDIPMSICRYMSINWWGLKHVQAKNLRTFMELQVSTSLGRVSTRKCCKFHSAQQADQLDACRSCRFRWGNAFVFNRKFVQADSKNASPPRWLCPIKVLLQI